MSPHSFLSFRELNFPSGTLKSFLIFNFFSLFFQNRVLNKYCVMGNKSHSSSRKVTLLVMSGSNLYVEKKWDQNSPCRWGGWGNRGEMADTSEEKMVLFQMVNPVSLWAATSHTTCALHGEWAARSLTLTVLGSRCRCEEPLEFHVFYGC